MTFFKCEIGKLLFLLNFFIVCRIISYFNHEIIMKSMIEYIFTAVIIFLVLFFYSCFVKPKAKLKALAQQFEAKGYHPWLMPYEFLGWPTLRLLLEAEKKGDAFMYLKKDYPKYDLIISNSLTTPIINLTHPDLLKEFYSQ